MAGVLKQGFKNREPRTKVLLPSKLRAGSGWVDACIHNVSSRGMLVASDAAPKPGTYVEVRRGSIVIIGRAVWAKDRFFGVRTQDRIDLAVLQRASAQAGATKAGEPTGRRVDDPLRKEAAAARALERNRALSRLAQFGLVALAAAAACVVVAAVVYKVLILPLSRIQHVITG